MHRCLRAVGVTDDRRQWDAFFASVHSLTDKVIGVGINDTTVVYEDGTPLQEVAAIQEYGLPAKNIPPRPWLAVTYYDPTTRQGLDALVSRVIGNMLESPASSSGAAKKIGEYYASRMQTIIRTFPWPPNAPLTLRNKTGDKPLIDTAKFVSHINAEIYDGLAADD